jgi:hypothetical protein
VRRGARSRPLERSAFWALAWLDCLRCGLIHTEAGEPFGGTLWPLARGTREEREAGLPKNPQGPRR